MASDNPTPNAHGLWFSLWLLVLPFCSWPWQCRLLNLSFPDEIKGRTPTGLKYTTISIPNQWFKACRSRVLVPKQCPSVCHNKKTTRIKYEVWQLSGTCIQHNTMSYNLVSFSFESESMTVHDPVDSPEHVGCGYLSSTNLMGSTMNFEGWRFQHPKRGTTAVLVPSNGHNICQRNLKKRCYWESVGPMRTKADVHANLNFCFLDCAFNCQKNDFRLGTWTFMHFLIPFLKCTLNVPLFHSWLYFQVAMTACWCNVLLAVARWCVNMGGKGTNAKTAGVAAFVSMTGGRICVTQQFSLIACFFKCWLDIKIYKACN